MKILSRLAISTIAVVLLSACGGNETAYQYNTRYLPVQLVGSEKWSILDVGSGEVIAKDAFDQAPSPIVAGMFYVQNSEGSYDYYSVKSPDKPVAGHFGSVTAFSDDGVAICSSVGGPLCVIDRTGNIVKQLPKEVSQCSMFSRGMASYQNDNGLWGYINTSGDTIVPAQYSNANPFMYNDLAVVVGAVHAGDSTVSFTVIDKGGNVKFTASAGEYQLVQPYYINGVLPAVKGDSLVCLDPDGQEVANPINDKQAVEQGGYSDISRTPSGDYIVRLGKSTGMVDKSGKSLVPIEFDDLVDINGERLIAIKDGVCHLIDRNGHAVGDVKFSNAHLSDDNPYATRGFINPNLAAAALMMMFDETSACGANAHTTLMDMNRMLSTDARLYAGSNTLILPQGPYIIQYVFDHDVSTMNADSTAASFNYDACVNRVIISLNLNHCPASTEGEIIKTIEGNLGTKGFVFARDGIFCSDYLTALTMGYDKGIMSLTYYMHFNESVPPTRNKRQ